MTGGKNLINGYKPVNVMRNGVKIAGWSPVTKTGQIVSFDKAYDDVAEISITNNQSQVQTSLGKNIFDIYRMISIGSTGTSQQLIKISAGKFRVRGWATTIMDNATIKSIFKPNTTYYVKLKYTLETLSALPLYSRNVSFNLYSAATGSVSFAYVTSLDTVGETAVVSMSFTTPADFADKVLLCYTNRYTDGTLIEYDTVLVENFIISETDIPYEPFVPDSPSPKYPSTIPSVGNMVLMNHGKNMFDTNGSYYVYNNVNLTNDGKILTGSVLSSAMSYIYKDLLYKYIGPMTCSAVFSTSPRILIRLFDKNKVNISSTKTLTGWSYNSFYQGLYNINSVAIIKTSDIDVEYFQIGFVFWGVDCTGSRQTISNIQLEFGEVPSIFRPFNGRNISITPTKPLYPTLDVIDLKNGLERHGMEVTVLDGSDDETWSLPTGITSVYSSYRITLFFKVLHGIFYCSHFKCFVDSMYTALPYSNKATSYPNSNQLIILVENSIADSLSQTSLVAWKAWLAANPITIIYPKETPTEYPLTLPEQPKTFYPYTQIYTDVNASLEVKAKVMD